MRLSCFIEPLEDRRLLAVTYYVSAAGNDNANGTSTSAAWKTIARVNKADLNAGDKVLFEGGKTFSVRGTTGSNVIANAGFESDLADWTDSLGSADGNATIVTTDAHTGSRALKLMGSGAANRAQDITTSLVPNQTYLMSSWTRS